MHIQYTNQPRPPKFVPTTTTAHHARNAAIFVVVVAVAGVIAQVLLPHPAVAPAPATVGRYEAWTACRTAVASRLKAPSTADFPGYSADYVHTDGGDYVVAAYVDSDNSFGAHIRSRFTCRISHSGASLAVTDVSVS